MMSAAGPRFLLHAGASITVAVPDGIVLELKRDVVGWVLPTHARGGIGVSRFDDLEAAVHAWLTSTGDSQRL